MTLIIGIIALFAMFGAVSWSSINKNLLKEQKQKSKQDNGKIFIWFLLVLGLGVRIFAAISYRGHQTDIGCFMGWSDMIYKDGLSQFYLTDGFHDYPPGYVYIMHILGAIRNIFNLSDGPVLWMVLKFPAIIADLAMSYLIYRITAKKFNPKAGAVISAFIIFNPTVIFNSCIWGQVDSILGFFCVLSVYFTAEKRFLPSYIAFAAALLIKPQAMFFAPVLLFGVIDEAFEDGKFKPKKILMPVLWALTAVAGMFVLFMPFGTNPIHGIEVILDQYIKTVGGYRYMTINAFNVYGMLGKNWDELTPFTTVIGYIGMFAVVVLAGVVFFRKKDKERYYIASFILVFGIYMLAPMMHERYAFPGIFMLMMLVAVCPTGKNFALYGAFSLSQFLNIAWVLLVYETDMSAYYKSQTIPIASYINLILFAVVLCLTLRNPDRVKPQQAKIQTNSNSLFRLSEKAVKITAFDIAAMLIITAVYGCVAFYKLGDKVAPESYTNFSTNAVTVDLGKEREISKTAFFLGARDVDSGRNLTFTYFDKNQQMIKQDVVEEASVFCWTLREDIAANAQFVTISSNVQENPNDPSDKIYLNEVCFLDAEGNVITPANTDADGVNNLFDEQDYLSAEKSYMTGSYFDEIYHPRTAYEFLHGMSVYEWTHPPLGKVLMGIGIMLFGMVPFGWRFIGTLFGVLMVPVVYLFAKRCLKYKWIAVLACVMFTFDFMHFTQTRLATIDTYVTFFIMLMYYFMYKYYKMSFYDTPLYKTLIPLGLSGIFFGLAVASKWTGLYAGVGLAVIFFMTIFDRYREYKKTQRTPKATTDGISHKLVQERFAKYTGITILFCCIMFVAVPFIIYVASYIPYMNTPSGEGLKTVFTNAESMLTYHGSTVVSSTHPYSSYWYEWPVIYRPLWYFSNTLDNGMRQGISAMGNPAVWWIGIVAVAYCLAVSVMIPLRNKNYYGKNKYYFAAAYTAVFTILCCLAGVSAAGNENLSRLVPCMLLYSIIFEGVYVSVTMFDYKIKQTSVRTPIFLLIGYFSGYMPWMLVLRTTYIYHYFPCVIFVVLMIGYCIKSLYENANNKKAVIISAIAYGVVSVGLFALFYPVISGQPVGLEFAQKWLKWFESWVLVA